MWGGKRPAGGGGGRGGGGYGGRGGGGGGSSSAHAAKRPKPSGDDDDDMGGDDEFIDEMLEDEEGSAPGSAPLLHAVSNYDGPPGGSALVHAVVEHFSAKFGWDITAENVALTNGSQSSFFYLFNALAGPCGEAGRKVLFPLCPEYLGYAEVGLSDGMFTSVRPRIDG